MRQRHKPWADDFIRENDNLFITDAAESPKCWQKVFGNDNPIHVEIGAGKGQFIRGMAEKYPDINFVGMEVAKSVIVTAGQKVLASDRTNIRLLLGDASLISKMFRENEVAVIYLNFSDPWPKNRHEKRRLTYRSFLQQYETILSPSGKIVMKTDNSGLFAYSLVSFSQYGMKLEEVSLDLHAEDDPENVQTEYEEKFSAKGQPIYRCQAAFDSKNIQK
ncbi:tRNA (guanosine(46)-N7)-methyltransferase TrmB [Virgibacillus sp. 179-BFC.A HS]|uniref:tRNA (guanine-N(7)-)-methyltransferase n=1 Tax=Tigheibacillus jepli TaxID=3035914 RepID=A0ABU5CG64_9BACI|nr:tRNA (guanosine(46)-N7)-methyltransferase TrmB [Virgibacillus sp. 179-BFC.A HS]MDY0405300.1 tRNA (guanosine(46)-N7)-methyltransferase TrmB [Virgibacillus sp. 179-BFC.A HS]